MKTLTIATMLTVVLSSSAMAGSSQEIMVSMTDAKGGEAGYVMLKEAHNGLIIQARMENIPEGWHGFHIHEVGSCEEAFKAAKGHYNPESVSHGINHGHKRHAGDLPNLYAYENGLVRTDIFTQQVTLAAGPTTLNDADGSSFIVHESADTYTEQAGAGGRIACGVISTGQ